MSTGFMFSFYLNREKEKTMLHNLNLKHICLYELRILREKFEKLLVSLNDATQMLDVN